jgi:hypothetical protein
MLTKRRHVCEKSYRILAEIKKIKISFMMVTEVQTKRDSRCGTKMSTFIKNLSFTMHTKQHELHNIYSVERMLASVATYLLQ